MSKYHYKTDIYPKYQRMKSGNTNYNNCCYKSVTKYNISAVIIYNLNFLAIRCLKNLNNLIKDEHNYSCDWYFVLNCKLKFYDVEYADTF